MTSQVSSQMMASTAVVAMPSAATLPVQPPVSRLEKLPPELRNAIYSMCIVTSVAIIRSPIKQVDRRRRPFSTFWCLLLANKNIHREASSWYYTFSTFVFGTNSWGSTRYPNLHAMKIFVQRVNKQQLAFITKIRIDLVPRARFNAPVSPDTRKYVIGDKDAIADLRSLSRTLLKHFHSLEHIKIVLDHHGPLFELHNNPFRLSKEETVEALKKFLLELLKLKGITCLQIFKGEVLDIPLGEAGERVLKENPDLSKILTFYEVNDNFGRC